MLPRRESGMQLLVLLQLKWQLSSKSSGCLLLLRFVSLTSRRTKVAMVLPTLPTLAIRTSLRIKLQKNKSQNQAPNSNAPYHRPLSEVTCNKCQQKGHHANKCFNQRRLPPPPPVRSSSNAVVKHNSKSAKVNMMNAAPQ